MLISSDSGTCEPGVSNCFVVLVFKRVAFFQNKIYLKFHNIFQELCWALDPQQLIWDKKKFYQGKNTGQMLFFELFNCSLYKIDFFII